MTDNQLSKKIVEAVNTIFASMSSWDFSIDQISFELNNEGPIWWFEFYGPKEEQPRTGYWDIVVDTARSICVMNKVIFIDSSAGQWQSS